MRKLLFLVLSFALLRPFFLMAQKTVMGNASYYADKFHGRKTASGEPYNKDSMTCAHLKYPFGTMLKVRNPINNQTVYVRVTDRGPYSRNRIIDLSRAAARKLDIIQAGFAMVEVTPVKQGEIPFRSEENEPFDLPELDFAFTPIATFPEPAWQSDSTKTWQKLKKLIAPQDLLVPFKSPDGSPEADE